MALKKYEVDAVVDTITKVINGHNEQIKITEKAVIKECCNKSSTFKKLLSIEEKLSKLRKEETSLINELRSEYKLSYGINVKYIFMGQVRDSLEEAAGKVSITKEDISNAVILSSGKDLNEIVKSVLKDLGFES